MKMHSFIAIIYRKNREEENITVTPIKLDETLEQQGPFDILVHKVTDEIADKHNKGHQQKIKYLEV